MKKITLFLFSVVFACSFMTAKAVNVTFQVNMNQVTDMHEGGSVWLLFDDWGVYYYMDDSDEDGIFSFTVDTAASTELNYSFSYQYGPDEWNDYVVETVPEECANESGYRGLLVPDSDTTLPAFYYETCSDKLMVDVTLNVDLRQVTDLHEDMGAWIFMDADWWEWYDMSDADGDSIFSVVLEREAGSTLPYRFSYQNGADPNADYTEEAVPGACANGDGFRELLVPDVDTNLPVFVYEDCTGANLVTYRVDLNGISDLHPGGAVWVLFGAWEHYYYMADHDGDNIYTYTLENIADTAISYSFSYQNGPDEWTEYVEEIVPEECANADGYRELVVEDGYTVLPAVAFGSCDETPVSKVNLTFNVDMSAETTGDIVHAVLKDPLWIWVPLTDGGEGVWSGSAEVPMNGTYPYTFVNGDIDDWGGEEKLPDECNMGTPSAPERHVDVAESDVVLDVVAFASCTDVPAGKVNVTFSVDMSAEEVSADGVRLVVKGPWIWTLMDDKGNGIWETTLLLNVNSTYPYTFVNGAQDYWEGEESVPEECNYGSASAPERRVVTEESDITLETVAFGGCPAVQSVNVTFRVDMNDEEVSADGVQLVIKEPWLWVALTNVGNGVWEASVSLPANMTYPYSYVNGAQDYWAGEEIIVGDCKDGDNNQRLAEIGSEDVILPAYVFGGCTAILGISSGISESLKVYPNPVGDILFVELNDSRIQTVSIIDVSGRVVAIQSVSNQQSISVDVSEISEGLYTVVVTGEEIHAVTRVVVSR